MLSLCALFSARALAQAQPAPAEPAFDARVPSTWRLSAKLGPGSPLRASLVSALTRPSANAQEAALTRAEAEALLDDPRAQRIYGEKTVSIVAPSMLRRQRQEHLDLLARFLTEERLGAGERFARTHAALLERAAARHRVQREVIVSILMFETRLGEVTGDWSAFNAFASQAWFLDEANQVALASADERALLDPKRQAQRVKTIAERARRNLLALVRGCKARGIDPLEIKGSWAGALGYPQFMPASLRWAEDGDGDGRIDLHTFPDAIASVARYLGDHGFARSRQRAVWAYNHEEAYVSGVLAWADALRARLAAPAGPMPVPAAAVGAPDAGTPAADAGGPRAP